MMKNKPAPIRLIFLLLAFGFGFSVLGKYWLPNFDQDVFIIGNFILFIVTLVSYLMLYRGLQSANPQSFVRAMYGSFIIKFFIIALAAFIYIMVAKKNVNKPALIACMFLYLLYTFLEVSVLTKSLKQKKNA